MRNSSAVMQGVSFSASCSLLSFSLIARLMNSMGPVRFLSIVHLPPIIVYSYYPAIGNQDTIELWNFIRDYGIVSNWHPVIYQFIFIYLIKEKVNVLLEIILSFCYFLVINYVRFTIHIR